MKKFFGLLLTLELVFVLVGCGEKSTTTTKETKGEGVLYHEEFLALKDGTEGAVIEAYIQAKTYKNTYGNVCLYLQDHDGGYYVYRMNVTDAQYDELKVGQKIKITGTKTSWSQWVEVAEGSATYELERGQYIAEAKDATEYWATLDDLIKLQNQKVKFSCKVAGTEVSGEERPFAYKYDGSGDRGADLYMNFKINSVVYTFLVETDLCNGDTDVYKAGEALTIGDDVEIEGFLCWYSEKPQLHITKITKVSK